MFLGHITDIASTFKKPLLQCENKKVLVNNSGKFTLMNNVCPHLGSLILPKTQQDLTCQFHAWSWDSEGNPLNQGTTSVCNHFKLPMKDVYILNNLLFTENLSIPSIECYNLSYMRLVEERLDIVNTNYKNIMDVFLDVDHISIVHKGVYPLIGVDGQTKVLWEYYDWGNIQFIQRNIEYSKAYAETLLGTPEEKTAAFWLALYPHTMIEWQPGALFVTVCIPDSDNVTKIVVFKYRDIRYSDTSWTINSEIWEKAWGQDRYQAEAIMIDCHVSSHLEKSKIHFRNWLEDKNKK